MELIIPTVTTQGGFTRASSASYFDSAGALQTAAIDEIRIGYNPLSLGSPPATIVENASTNILLNSATVVTQDITVTATQHTLSFYGTGTITLSGAHSHAVVGLGVSPVRTTYRFTPTAGTLTLTVVGSCTWGQLEHGATATSYIATTAAPITRAADVLTNGLVYSSIPETDHPVWDAATTYVIGDLVILNHRRYKSLRDANLNFNPTTDTTTPPYWLDIGATNRYAMFDGKIGTQSVSDTGEIVVVIKSGILNGISFMEMDAESAQVSLTTTDGIVYSNTIDLSSEAVTDWWLYFTEPIERVTDYVLTDVPSYLTGVLTVVLSVPTGSVKCGNLVNGVLFNLGSTESSPTIGIVDYSVKTIDAFGNPTLTVRAYSKRMNAKMLIDTPRVDSVTKKLASVRSTPCVWIGSGNSLQSLIVYGYYKDFEVDIAYKTQSYCTIQVEGLT